MTARSLRLFVVVACVGALAFGIWYVRGGGLREDDQDIADDDEMNLLKPDGGPHRRLTKKRAPGLKKKASEARQARGPAVRHAGGPTPAGPSGMSYEAAISGNNLKLAPGTMDAPDLTDAELASPMRDATFLDTCGVPTSTHVTVKVAIQHGRAVGVSVVTTPPNREIAGCLERHVRGIQWSPNAKMDSFVTTY